MPAQKIRMIPCPSHVILEMVRNGPEDLFVRTEEVMKLVRYAVHRFGRVLEVRETLADPLVELPNETHLFLKVRFEDGEFRGLHRVSFPGV